MAEIVAPTFCQNEAEFTWNHAVQEREVFLDKLFLQTDCVRRDDDAFVCGDIRIRVFLGDCQDRRYQVGETLPDTGSRFTDQVMSFAEGGGDGICHFPLLWPLFIMRKPRRNTSFRSEDVVRCEHGQLAGR